VLAAILAMIFRFQFEPNCLRVQMDTMRYANLLALSKGGFQNCGPIVVSVFGTWKSRRKEIHRKYVSNFLGFPKYSDINLRIKIFIYKTYTY